MDGKARAFLSNRYRRIDNPDIARVVLPIIGEMEGARFESCEITDVRMYLKVVNPRLQAEVVPGDIVQAGILFYRYWNYDLSKPFQEQFEHNQRQLLAFLQEQLVQNGGSI